MIKSIFTVCIFLCLQFFSFGQKVNKKATIALLDSIQMDKQTQIILIETDSIILSTTYSLLSKQLRKNIRTNKNFSEDLDSIYKAVRLKISKKIIRIDDISNHLKVLLAYQIGDLLRQGHCFAYNKLTKLRIKKVRMIDYGNYSYGSTGKQYYLDKILLLDNTEIVF